MSKKVQVNFLRDAASRGLVGARLQHAHSGPRLVGTIAERRVKLPFPRKEMLTDEQLKRALLRLLEREVH